MAAPLGSPQKPHMSNHGGYFVPLLMFTHFRSTLRYRKLFLLVCLI
jgi:hypothetical protein